MTLSLLVAREVLLLILVGAALIGFLWAAMRTGWSWIGKTLLVIGLVGIASFVVKMPLRAGIWGLDHGWMVDLLATAGVVWIADRMYRHAHNRIWVHVSMTAGVVISLVGIWCVRIMDDVPFRSLEDAVEQVVSEQSIQQSDTRSQIRSVQRNDSPDINCDAIPAQYKPSANCP